MDMTAFIDTLVFVCASLSNMLITGIMLSRPAGKPRLELTLGWANIALALPLAAAAIWNATQGRPWWGWVMPAVMVLYLLIEMLLDYILKVPFRQSRWLWAYLLLFYLAQWALIGYTFITNPTYGAITLITYFISLGATAYSYRKVGHG